MLSIMEIIYNKRHGKTLSPQEIDFWIKGALDGSIPDYQTSALLMAICIQGMTPEETASLTHSMACSGERMDLSALPGIKVDKHSTGGVGDKTTLVIGPIVAAAGGVVAKLSGRGLGFTGGTLDKLEAIPGMNLWMDTKTFISVASKIGFALMGQTANIAPADKKLYALRDVTGTVDSIPLIASSVMSKKLASGADRILLDVKYGSGAFMKTKAEAEALADLMVHIGNANNKPTAALTTSMEVPLGRAIGNSLEVMEAMDTLKCQGPQDLTNLSLELAAQMLVLSEKGTYEECHTKAQKALETGKAYETFLKFVEAQGGDVSILERGLAEAPCSMTLTAPNSGTITAIDTELCGLVSVGLGAGRLKAEDSIDFSAGIVILKKTGEQVSKGEPLARLYASKPELLEIASKRLVIAYKC